MAAVSLAYAGAGDDAEQACNDIVNLARDTGHISGYPPGTVESDDLGKKAMTEKNLCLYDTAKAYARRDAGRALTMCAGISEADLGWAIAGAPVTRDMCEEQVEGISALNYEEYHEHGICAIVLIFPLLFLASLKKR